MSKPNSRSNRKRGNGGRTLTWTESRCLAFGFPFKFQLSALTACNLHTPVNVTPAAFLFPFFSFFCFLFVCFLSPENSPPGSQSRNRFGFFTLRKRETKIYYCFPTCLAWLFPRGLHLDSFTQFLVWGLDKVSNFIVMMLILCYYLIVILASP